MTDFSDLIDLAGERLGGTVLAANDEFFAPKENLLKTNAPIFIEGKYTDRGKWMDGWESRRRREPGHDWCVIRLGAPGLIRGIVVDTTHFKGNHPESCSIEASSFLTGSGDWDALTAAGDDWVEILPRSPLRGDSRNLFPVAASERATHVRLNIFPDGGVARLRVHGDVMPDWQRLARRPEIDLAAVENGGMVVACSDMFFGSRQNLIMPGRPTGMSDGWETRRRRGPGHDWAVIQLGTRGRIHRIEVDTSHFKGNAPGSCSLETPPQDSATADLSRPELQWTDLLPQTPLHPHTRHTFDDNIRDVGPVTHVRFNIFPDGGVGRLRLWGSIDRVGA